MPYIQDTTIPSYELLDFLNGFLVIKNIYQFHLSIPYVSPEELLDGLPEESHHLVRKAYRLAEEKHAHMKRKGSGMPYIVHPFRAAKLLQPLHDYELICAALLHDVVEDSDVTIEQIYKEFGEDIAFLVDACTKETGKDQIQKVIEFSRQDKRAMLVKLADRVDNMTDHPSIMSDHLRQKYIEQGRQLLEACRVLNITFLVDQLGSALSQLFQ